MQLTTSIDCLKRWKRNIASSVPASPTDMPFLRTPDLTAYRNGIATSRVLLVYYLNHCLGLNIEEYHTEVARIERLRNHLTPVDLPQFIRRNQ
jgi:hypothetical protein